MKSIMTTFLLGALTCSLGGCATHGTATLDSAPSEISKSPYDVTASNIHRTGPIYNIKSYGAIDDGKALNIDAFAKAIADCKKAGGGIVEVPAGRYLTGPINMVDNMTLQVDAGAFILFDPDRTKYPDIHSRWEGKDETGPHPLLFADGPHNIAIVGAGTIDGQGQTWWTNMDQRERGNARPDPNAPGFTPVRRRPPLVQIRNCENVRVDGITFLNSPFWCIHLLYSENIDFGNCKIMNPPTSPNTDALNSDSCRRVLVHDCYADVGDDGFGIKSGRDEEGRKVGRPTEYLTYTHLKVDHAHGVCVIGSEQSGGVRHIRFLDNEGNGTDAGVRIKSTRGRGGTVEDIVASNFRLTNVKTAIILTMRYTQSAAEALSERTPLFRDIHIDHIAAVGCNQCALIQGLDERAIENITLSDLNLSGARGITVSNAKNILFTNSQVAAQNGPTYAEDHSQDIKKINWTDLPFTPAPARTAAPPVNRSST